MRLGFTGNELSAIVREPGRTHEEHYYSAMLMRWLDWAPPNHHRPSVQRLSSALREVGYEGLAFDLDVQYHESGGFSGNLNGGGLTQDKGCHGGRHSK